MSDISLRICIMSRIKRSSKNTSIGLCLSLYCRLLIKFWYRTLLFKSNISYMMQSLILKIKKFMFSLFFGLHLSFINSLFNNLLASFFFFIIYFVIDFLLKTNFSKNILVYFYFLFLFIFLSHIHFK